MIYISICTMRTTANVVLVLGNPGVYNFIPTISNSVWRSRCYSSVDAAKDYGQLYNCSSAADTLSTSNIGLHHGNHQQLYYGNFDAAQSDDVNGFCWEVADKPTRRNEKERRRVRYRGTWYTNNNNGY